MHQAPESDSPCGTEVHIMFNLMHVDSCTVTRPSLTPVWGWYAPKIGAKQVLGDHHLDGQVEPHESERAGRFVRQAKTECGRLAETSGCVL